MGKDVKHVETYKSSFVKSTLVCDYSSASIRLLMLVVLLNLKSTFSNLHLSWILFARNSKSTAQEAIKLSYQKQNYHREI